MGAEIDYRNFLDKLDSNLKAYFDLHKEYICCKPCCCSCCEQGDYPLSEVELRYLMKGYSELENSVKKQIQYNIKNMKKGGACPFLVNSLCSVYFYRPIICRIHGLAYLYEGNIAKVPYCVNEGKNYSNVYLNGELLTEPIKENLEENMRLGVVKNLYDWIKL